MPSYRWLRFLCVVDVSCRFVSLLSHVWNSFWVCLSPLASIPHGPVLLTPVPWSRFTLGIGTRSIPQNPNRRTHPSLSLSGSDRHPPTHLSNRPGEFFLTAPPRWRPIPPRPGKSTPFSSQRGRKGGSISPGVGVRRHPMGCGSRGLEGEGEAHRGRKEGRTWDCNVDVVVVTMAKGARDGSDEAKHTAKRWTVNHVERCRTLTRSRGCVDGCRCQGTSEESSQSRPKRWSAFQNTQEKDERDLPQAKDTQTCERSQVSKDQVRPCVHTQARIERTKPTKDLRCREKSNQDPRHKGYRAVEPETCKQT